MRKIIRPLPPSWEVKATTLNELNDKKEMKLIGLIGNLKTHEMKRKYIEEKAPQKKKTLAFKSTPTISDEDEKEDDDKDLYLLIKNIRTMYTKAKFENRRKWQSKEERKKICYNCRKLGHVIVECPETKKKPTTSKKLYKK